MPKPFSQNVLIINELETKNYQYSFFLSGADLRKTTFDVKITKKKYMAKITVIRVIITITIMHLFAVFGLRIWRLL